MKKTLLIFILLMTSVSYGESVNRDSLKNPSSKEIYESLTKDVGPIGEEDGLTEKAKVNRMMDWVTNLLSWNYSASSDNKVFLTSGIFAVLNPPKLKVSKEEGIYKDFFSREGYGTGFLYKNYIVTNYHVCRGMNVLIRDVNDKVYGVKVLTYDLKQDICILKAPEGVLDQVNFNNIKMALDPIEEEKQILRLAFAIDKEKDENKKQLLKDKRELLKKELKYSHKLSNGQDRSLANDKEEAVEVVNEFSARNYGRIMGVFGTSFIYGISKDLTKDQWSKDESFTAFGNKCVMGMSGSPVISPNGLRGLFWGAEMAASVKMRTSLKKISNPHEKLPSCYFLDKSEIDRVIGKIK